MYKSAASLISAVVAFMSGSLLAIAASVDVDLQSSPDGTTWTSVEAGLVASDASPVYYRATVTPTGGIESVSNTILVDRPVGSPAHLGLESSPDLTTWSEDLQGTKDVTASKAFFRVREDDALSEFIYVTGNGTSISDFLIGQFEVTQEIWDDVYVWALAKNPDPYDFSNNSGGNWLAGGCVKAAHPVSEVTWYDAVKWCNARSEKEGLTPAYYTDAGFLAPYRTGEVAPSLLFVDATANGYRLSTSAEWAYAAQGGNLSQGYTYSGSNTVDDVARYNTNSVDSECPTIGTNGTWKCGSLLPNELGTYDMSGNVMEWNFDGPNDGSRNAAGGYFFSDANNVKSTSSTQTVIDLKFSILGLRLALNAPPAEAAIVAPKASTVRQNGKSPDHSRSKGSRKNLN